MGLYLPYAEHLVYKSESGYRRYSSAVEKNLQTFESISEWADVISFLTRLIRVLLYGFVFLESVCVDDHVLSQI